MAVLQRTVRYRGRFLLRRQQLLALRVMAFLCNHVRLFKQLYVLYVDPAFAVCRRRCCRRGSSRGSRRNLDTVLLARLFYSNFRSSIPFRLEGCDGTVAQCCDLAGQHFMVLGKMQLQYGFFVEFVLAHRTA